MDPLVIQDVKSYQVEELRFRFDGWGWANVFLHDWGSRCGELVIHSDWGTFGYVWSGIPDDEDLLTFLIRADCDYLARKLLPGEASKEWDPAGTRSAIVEELLSWKQDGHSGVNLLLKALSRCCWDSGPVLWNEWAPQELHDALNPLSDWICYQPTAQWSILKEGLLPTVKKYLKDRQRKRSSSV
uniref:Uncharacterized protein n=1 Tax=viral metagenome TaxID=1070528 RepID=A0A6H1Z8R1_9ZZZZ